MTPPTIDTDVPPPEQDRRRYSFDRLEPGASMFIPIDSEADARRIRQAASKYAARRGVRFATQARIEDGRRGVRVWRVS